MRFRALIKVIISHVRLFMIISHVKIIAFQLSLFCKNYRFSKTALYIINRKIHVCFALIREISCSTLKINLVFPRTHVLFSIYAGGGGGATKRNVFLGKNVANPTIKKSKYFLANLEYELKNKYPPLAKNFTKGIPFSCHTSHLPLLSHEFDKCNFR